ncbi:radical SAM protein [Allonocardiopsis opalescens]|uniref:MoaA/NifB/PqqE/SkfB family radical SAM enzyme n=1 Tax=Allonocardiopsis opalescens TaxID=1144618 RepID=A0A2T0Q9S9_9ACTN|nr:radical SAM protein [Allonocardiopsis opalescens]PRY00603.1 MoaA/NifB/PqqE/SkfB family radical SAM enzyme [Allonocardiopsis opalescens]
MSVAFLELEITGRCQLACAHCYADSGPWGGHGVMTVDDWVRVIDQAPDAGVLDVQFIGGEPTLHPAFPELMRHALDAGLGAEVYSNLAHVRPEWWELFQRPKVYLAFSYYSDDPAEHDAITRRPGSHARTLANVRRAVGLGVPLRAGIVAVRQGQRVDAARRQLEAIGVRKINTDRMRGVGRGRPDASVPTVRELCGRCGRRNAAVSSDGDVWGCTLSRFLPPAGNVRTQRLADILHGAAMARLVAAIPPRGTGCSPDDGCHPEDSAPSVCGPELR